MDGSRASTGRNAERRHRVEEPLHLLLPCRPPSGGTGQKRPPRRCARRPRRVRSARGRRPAPRCPAARRSRSGCRSGSRRPDRSGCGSACQHGASPTTPVRPIAARLSATGERSAGRRGRAAGARRRPGRAGAASTSSAPTRPGRPGRRASPREVMTPAAGMSPAGADDERAAKHQPSPRRCAAAWPTSSAPIAANIPEPDIDQRPLGGCPGPGRPGSSGQVRPTPAGVHRDDGPRETGGEPAGPVADRRARRPRGPRRHVRASSGSSSSGLRTMRAGAAQRQRRAAPRGAALRRLAQAVANSRGGTPGPSAARCRAAPRPPRWAPVIAAKNHPVAAPGSRSTRGCRGPCPAAGRARAPDRPRGRDRHGASGRRRRRAGSRRRCSRGTRSGGAVPEADLAAPDAHRRHLDAVAEGHGGESTAARTRPVRPTFPAVAPSTSRRARCPATRRSGGNTPSSQYDAATARNAGGAELGLLRGRRARMRAGTTPTGHRRRRRCGLRDRPHGGRGGRPGGLLRPVGCGDTTVGRGVPGNQGVASRDDRERSHLFGAGGRGQDGGSRWRSRVSAMSRMFGSAGAELVEQVRAHALHVHRRGGLEGGEPVVGEDGELTAAVAPRNLPAHPAAFLQPRDRVRERLREGRRGRRARSSASSARAPRRARPGSRSRRARCRSRE